MLTIRTTAVAAVAAALLAGCASPKYVVHAGTPEPRTTGPLSSKPAADGVSAPPHTPALSAADIGAAQTAFGVDFLHASCKGPANVVVSATSAAEALGLLYAASAGETAKAMGTALHLPPWGPSTIAGTADHTQALGDIRGPNKGEGLFISNHVWTGKESKPTQHYLDDVATAYKSDVRSVDFAGDAKGATDAINGSVDKDTHGLIKKLFDQPLDASTTTVLTDAMYLKARWVQPFEFTTQQVFHAPSADVTVPMMSGASGPSREAGGWRSVELPYVGGKLMAVAILPPLRTDPCAITTAQLATLTAGPSNSADVLLPKLHVEQTHDLLGPLKALGVPLSGDFSGLGGGSDVSQAVQKTFLDIDEAGTTAAAATGVAVALSGRMSLTPPIVFDRPYLFLLTDTATHSPLFTAVVNDPTRQS